MKANSPFKRSFLIHLSIFSNLDNIRHTAGVQ